ncbi:aryl-sulfate sulfotransferase [Halobaculum magnesiiphilum]|uniref:Arylsulfotransferase family protein n=1 Tax=Halobaculum magnesiiphilum TaxID=1017351 RepID=A0A8T8WBK7_9EURY|nr:aryl-sulfate sulfotransferase [Halobaculum magnesiiphilum]QZP37237.1 arylsulfotransferase family protein [Halobaculum magnesiiphilum]
MATSLPVSRRTAARALTALVVLGLFAPAAAQAIAPGDTGTPGTVGLESGTIDSEADNSTVVAIQGFHFQGQGSQKKPARLVQVTPDGSTDWVYDGSNLNARWFYDVDPLANGNLLVVGTNPTGTVVAELDRETREPVWTERFDFHDTHDVEMLPSGNLLIANMRNWNEEEQRSDDRILVYNRSTEEIDWEWTFRNHYPNSTDGGFSEDWTHVNDVDRIGEGQYLVSPRNFDQAIVVNRSTKEIDYRLGEDDDHDIMNEQHNPDWLVSEDGNPTILVADSENDRVVEYERRDGEWVEVWEVGTGQLSWPRDADRLPNGNTLITDSLNHRVIEVTPQGEIVWEYYATWGPYDAERIGTGAESNGPTMADQGVSGSYQIYGSAGLIEGTGGSLTFAGAVQNTFAGTPLGGPAQEFATRWAHVTPWIRPAWMGSWAFAGALAGTILLFGWAFGEAFAERDSIRRGMQKAARDIRAR